MTAISKLIAISLFVLPLTIFSDLESTIDNTALAEKDLQVLNVIESTIIAEKGKFLQYYDDVNYELDESSTIHSQRFNITSIIGDYNAPITTYKYLIVDNAIGQTSQVFLHYDDCKNDIAILKWKDDTIDEISYDRNSYKIEYNEAGLVRKLVETSFYKFGKKYLKSYYTINYTRKGLISKLEKHTVVGKGKKAYRAQFDWEYLNSEINYTYKENRIDIVHTSYNEQTKKSKSPNKTTSQKSTLIFDEKGYTRKIYAANDDNKVVKVYDKILNEKGKVIRSIETSPDYNQKLIKSFEYNPAGKIIREVVKAALGDEFDGHYETLYDYKKSDGKGENSSCAYDIITSNNVYSSEGDLIKQTREDGMQRIKTNGNWSNWKAGLFVFGVS